MEGEPSIGDGFRAPDTDGSTHRATIKMDPLSFTASLVALSSLVGTFSKAVRVVVQLKQAEAGITHASDRLEIIQRLVDQFEEFEECEGTKLASSTSAPDFARIQTSILRATRSLIHTSRAAFPLKDVKSRRERHIKNIKWVIKDRKAVDNLQTELNNLGSLLSITLQAETANRNKYLAQDVGSLTEKQNLMYDHVVFIRDGMTARNEESFSTSRSWPSGRSHLPPRGLMQACVMRSRFDIPGVMVQYYRSAGQRKHFSLLFGFKLPGANVVFARFSGPTYAIGIPNLRIRVQHMVPEDSRIFTSCKAGNVLEVRDLLETKRASLNDITTRNETLLTAACDSRNAELVELLLHLGADPNQTCGKLQTSPLHVAFELHDPVAARKLLRYGADLDYCSARGWNVIHHLWQDRRKRPLGEEFFQICSERGFSSANVQDGAGWTCLHRAAAFGGASDIKELFRLGASLTIYTKQHARTPIHVASAMNNVETLTELSTHVTQYNLHSPDANGWTPLHLATSREAEDTMRFLLNQGANPHAQSNITATWFPVGLEHQILYPSDLALDCGVIFWEKYVDALRDAGWRITTSSDSEDVYWDSQEYFDDELPRYEAGKC